MPERFVKQFHKLETLEPRAEWLNSTRDFLVKKVERDTITYQTSWKYHFKVVMLDWQQRFVPATSKLIATLVIFGLISTTGLAARAEYRPDRTLYFVKKTLEKIELVLAMSTFQEAEIYLKHVQNRKDEIQKLANSDKLSSQEKTKHINTVVTKLKQDLTSASASLDLAEQNNGKIEKITDLAKKITENSKDTVSILNQVNSDVKLLDIKEVVSSAIMTSVGTEESAMVILIEKLESPDGSNIMPIAEDDLKSMLKDMIERADSRLQSNLEKLGKLKLDLDNIKCGYTRSSYTCVNVPLVEIRDGVYDGLIESSKQVGDLIVIANEQLDKDSIETLDSIGKMNLLLSKIDDGLYKIYNKEEVVETVDGELNNIDENNNSEVKGVTEEIIPENIEVIKGVTETTVDIIKEEDTE